MAVDMTRLRLNRCSFCVKSVWFLLQVSKMQNGFPQRSQQSSRGRLRLSMVCGGGNEWTGAATRGVRNPESRLAGDSGNDDF